MQQKERVRSENWARALSTASENSARRLITAAVTGQIDVSTWGKQGTADRRFDQIEEATSA